MHDLEMVNGKGIMFSARNQSPWHKLGLVVDKVSNAAEAIRLLGTSTVHVEQVFTKDNTPIDGQFCTRRQEDGAVFGMVSDRYHVLQDADAFELADVLVQAGEATYETAGRLRGGARTWLQLRLNGGSDNVGGNDTIERFMMISNSHDGKQAVKVGFCDTRIVCANTLSAAINSEASKLLRVRHSAKMIPALQDIRLAMDTVRSEFKATVEVYNRMAQSGISRKDLEKYVCKVFGADPSDPPRCLPVVLDSFDNGAGHELAGETMWGALNAITNFTTHTQGRSDEARLDNSMWGTSAKTNEVAAQLAYNYVVQGPSALSF